MYVRNVIGFNEEFQCNAMETSDNEDKVVTLDISYNRVKNVHNIIVWLKEDAPKLWRI